MWTALKNIANFASIFLLTVHWSSSYLEIASVNHKANSGSSFIDVKIEKYRRRELAHSQNE